MAAHGDAVMARHRRDYSGEKLTEFVGFQVTPTQRESLETAAKGRGTTLSQHARELCLRRSTAQQVVAGTRRAPETQALLKELTTWGNNLNQLARRCNTDGTAPQREELKATMAQLKVAIDRVLKL